MLQPLSIAILTCWYGNYPWYFPYFIHSCSYNPILDLVKPGLQVIVTKFCSRVSLSIQINDKAAFTLTGNANKNNRIVDI